MERSMSFCRFREIEVTSVAPPNIFSCLCDIMSDLLKQKPGGEFTITKLFYSTKSLYLTTSGMEIETGKSFSEIKGREPSS